MNHVCCRIAAIHHRIAVPEGDCGGQLCGIFRASDHVTNTPDSSCRILVVDDDAVTRRVATSKLTGVGFEPIAVGHGEEALALIEENADERGCDLVLLDVELPGDSGLDILRQIRKRYSAIELPVIMVTSRHDSEDIVVALEAEANDYVTKPIDFPVLLARINTHLTLKKSHMSLKSSHQALIQAAKMESVIHFAGGFAQEIRQPLTKAKVGLMNLRNALPGDETNLAELLGRVDEALAGPDQIVSKLIAASSEHRLQLTASPINAFINSALELLGDTLGEAQVELRLQLSEGDPPALIAAEELQKAFVNLALNAIEALSPGGKLTIRSSERRAVATDDQESARAGARIRPGELTVVIEIEDSGPGMSDEQLERAFDPFYSGRAKKTGMGLTVARKIVELHGGTLSVENRSFGSGVKATLQLRRQA
jgi:two-component system, NtrC family, sensor histidine kinase HydH